MLMFYFIMFCCGLLINKATIPLKIVVLNNKRAKHHQCQAVENLKLGN